jgi:serine/threonine protein kinase
MISNRHCRIFCTLPGTAFEEPADTTMAAIFASIQVWIEDCSGNGTVINGTAVLQKGDRRQLHSGDEICLVLQHTLQKKIPSRTELQSLLQQYSFVFVNCVASTTASSPKRSLSLLPSSIVESTSQSVDPVFNVAPPSTARRSKRKAAVDVRATKSTRPRFSMETEADKATQEQQRHGRDSISSTAADAPNRRISPRRLPPRRIQHDYDVRDILGKGTMGEVHRAIHRQSGQTVAIKTIPCHPRGNLLTSQTMEMEAAILRKLQHPYIVKLLDVYTSPTALFLVMELVPGGDLFDRIDRKGYYSETDARRVMRRLLAAVYYLHETCGIVHRDLKPENILLSSLTSDIDVQLTDFGLAKPDGDCKTFCGTPQYFAPEVLRRRHTVKGAGRYGKQADMWSLGVILYVLLTGTMPFDSPQEESAGPMSSQQSNTAEAPILEFPPFISLAAQDMMRQLLQYDPRKRSSVLSACSHAWILQDDGDTHIHPLDDPKLLEFAPGGRDHSVNVPSSSTFPLDTTKERSTALTDSSCDHVLPSPRLSFSVPPTAPLSTGSSHKVVTSAHNFSFQKEFQSGENSSPVYTNSPGGNPQRVSLLEGTVEDSMKVGNTPCALSTTTVSSTLEQSLTNAISPTTILPEPVVHQSKQPFWAKRDRVEDLAEDDVLSKFTENTESLDSFSTIVNDAAVQVKENVPLHTDIPNEKASLQISKRPSLQPRTRGKSQNPPKGTKRRRRASVNQRNACLEKSMMSPRSEPQPTIYVKKISSGGKQTTLKTWFKKQR